jgi:hypothetical protein
MKKFLVNFSVLWALCLWGQTSALANTTNDISIQDSLIIQANGRKIVIYVANQSDKEKLQVMYDKGILNDALRYLRTEQLADTALVKDNYGEYRIIKQKGETVIYFDKVREVTSSRTYSYNANANPNRNSNNNDNYSDRWSSRRSSRLNIDYDFGADFGMNMMLPKSGTLSGTLYELTPLRSNYLAFSIMSRHRLGRYARARIGLEISWYNFMFERDTRIAMKDNGLELTADPNGLRKSKLAASFLNIPAHIEIGRRWGMTLGVGGYVGYRIDSWTKAVTNGGDKQKDNDGYYLNNFRYGVSTQIGLGWAKFFANYDLNSLFVSGKAPEMNVLSIGVRFM